MNSLVALGTGAGLGFFSVVATYLPNLLPANTQHVYYEAAGCYRYLDSPWSLS